MEDLFKNTEDETLTELENRWENVKSFIDDLKNLRKQHMEPKLVHFLQEIDNYMEKYLEETEVVKPKRKVVTNEETMKKCESEPTEEEFDIGDKVLEETVKNKDADLMNVLLTKLDNRTVPCLEDFNDDGGMNLEQYIHKFESYCRENYKGGRDLWIGELEKRLSGKTLDGFRSVRQLSEGYETLRNKLLEWYDEEEEVRRKKAKKKFDNARMNNGESLTLYGNRLLTLFKRAFPGKRYEMSGTLIDKYRSTIPLSVKNLINSQILSYKLENRQITWTQIQKCARVCELESKEVYEDGEDDDVVVINFSKDVRRKQRWCDDDYEERELDSYKPYRRNEEERKHFGRNTNQFPENRERENVRAWRSTAVEKETCTFCMKYGHTVKDCRNKDGSCYKCGTVGHFARQCRRGNGNQREYSDDRQKRKESTPDAEKWVPRYQRSTNREKSAYSQGSGRNYRNLN